MAAPDSPPCLSWVQQSLLTQPSSCLLLSLTLGAPSDRMLPVTLLVFQMLFTVKQVLIFLHALIA